MSTEHTFVYHFTRVEHLQSIVRHGLLCDSRAQELGLLQIEVGNVSIKALRAATAVPLPPGGTVANYAPFYYAFRSPMMYSIHRGNVPTYTDGCDRLVYLVTTLERLEDAALTTLGTDRNAVLAFAEWEQGARITRLVDWPLMHARYWNNTAEDPDRVERRMAECLVHESVPWEVFLGVAAKSDDVGEAAKRQITSAGAAATAVAVKPKWFF